MTIIKISILVMSLSYSFMVLAETQESSISDSIENVNFEGIKDVLKKDMLIEHAQKKVEAKEQQVVARRVEEQKRFNLPDEDEFWSLMSEFYLVEKVTEFRWDFEKPDYGVDVAFKALLESMGFYELHYKILYLDSPTIPHFSLPSNKGEHIFIVSVPFIRNLDLSKLEISLLLLSDLLRAKEGYFKKFVINKEIQELIGGNYWNKKFPKKSIKTLIKRYDYFIQKKGFTFQQQFEITKKMSRILSGNLRLFKAYDGLLVKIDKLAKENVLFKFYPKIYPSPEMQIQWFRPKAKEI